MKVKQVTTWLRTLAQLPVAILLWGVVVIEHGLTHCLRRLRTPLLCKPATSILGRIVEGRGSDTRSDFDVFWDWLESQDADVVADRRRLIERKCGVPVSARCNDPHLYAVLEPTKDENLLRIMYVLKSLPPWRLRKFVGEAAEILR